LAQIFYFWKTNLVFSKGLHSGKWQNRIGSPEIKQQKHDSAAREQKKNFTGKSDRRQLRDWTPLPGFGRHLRPGTLRKLRHHLPPDYRNPPTVSLRRRSSQAKRCAAADSHSSGIRYQHLGNVCHLQSLLWLAAREPFCGRILPQGPLLDRLCLPGGQRSWLSHRVLPCMFLSDLHLYCLIHVEMILFPALISSI
jgi:hypothetical protein